MDLLLVLCEAVLVRLDEYQLECVRIKRKRKEITKNRSILAVKLIDFYLIVFSFPFNYITNTLTHNKFQQIGQDIDLATETSQERHMFVQSFPVCNR